MVLPLLESPLAKAKNAGIKGFDRNGRKYHGCVKTLQMPPEMLAGSAHEHTNKNFSADRGKRHGPGGRVECREEEAADDLIYEKVYLLTVALRSLGGRRFSFSALVVAETVGAMGVGYGKARVPESIRKGSEKA